MIAAGAINLQDLPTFDDESGTVAVEENEEEVEIELNDVEPLFLK